MTNADHDAAKAGKAKRLTKKAFREYLNQQLPITISNHRSEHSHNGKRVLFGQRKRGYGDYLYDADREKFNAEYEEWAWEQHHAIDGKLTNCTKAKP